MKTAMKKHLDTLVNMIKEERKLNMSTSSMNPKFIGLQRYILVNKTLNYQTGYHTLLYKSIFILKIAYENVL